MRITMLVGALAVAMRAGDARAQVAEKKVLTMEGARRVADAVVTEARRLNTTGVVAIVDDGGNLMYLERVDGTFPAGGLISYGKARTSAIFKKPSGFFENLIKSGRTPMIALNDFTPLQGGFPLELGGQVVGGIGVSGAASAQQDEELAMAGVAAFATATQAMLPVSVFPKTQVEASFAKGGVLIGDQPDRGYQVHTSRRDQPGVVEVHTLDTDVLYMVSGAATLVTGGKLLGGKEIGPNEIRGTDIEGGESRTLARGDVIVIPAGTPHWFKSVDGPVTYYAVKAR